MKYINRWWWWGMGMLTGFLFGLGIGVQVGYLLGLIMVIVKTR